MEGHPCSAIITSFADRGGEIVGMWWPLYPLEGETALVAVHNRLILRDTIDGRFSIQTCYEYVGPRNTRTEDGETVSEWSTTLGELAAFVTRVEARKRLWPC